MSERADEFKAAIEQAKQQMPLPDLLRSYGLQPPARGRGNIPSPFSQSAGRGKSPSFSIFCKNGAWGWKDRSGGGETGGDEITFVEKFEGVNRAEAIRRYLDKAGVEKGAQRATSRKAHPVKHTAKRAKGENKSYFDVDIAFDWPGCVASFTSEHAAKLAKWRGYSPEFVAWLHGAALVGLRSGKIAFPVEKSYVPGDIKSGGRIIAAHYLAKKGAWRYHPAGLGMHPLVIGDLATAQSVAVFESQWDAFAIMDRMGWHVAPPGGWAVFVTRGASNGAMVADIPPGRSLYCFRQNDEEKHGARAGDKWLAAIATAYATGRVFNVLVPPQHKDANEWTLAETVDAWAAITAAREVEKPAPESVAGKGDGADAPEFDPAAVADAVGVFWLNESDRYFLPGKAGKWLGMGTAELRRILKTEHGVRTRVREGELSSDMDRALVFINRNRTVDFAASLAGWKAGVYDMGGAKVLVRDSPRLIEPREGDWSTIEQLLYGCLHLPGCDQVPYFNAWMKLAYESARKEIRRPGQAVIFIGEANSCKSRIQHHIVTPLLGGRNADPKSFFFGRTDFNAELIGSEHLLIEEIPAITRYDDRNSFGERIKEAVVNDTERLHKKNRDAVTVSIWRRLTISLNDDQVRALPPMTTGLMDKVHLFKVQAPAGFWEQFANAPDDRAAFRDTIERELPAYAYYLEHMEIPEKIRARRFGVQAFHNLEMLEELFEQEPECLLLDMIDREIFGNESRRDPGEKWEGGAIDLENWLKADASTVQHQARKLLSHEQACSQNLAKLRKRFPLRIEKPPHTREKRLWLIHPPRPAE